MTIDGIDVVTFMVATSLIQVFQDPDASYNTGFFELAPYTILPGNFGTFTFPQVYPGANTTLAFANGSSVSIPNVAVVKKDLSGITNGEDMYSAFCTPSSTDAAATSSAPASKRQASTALSSSTASAIPLPTSPGYPYPVVKHSANFVAGYFLNDTGNENVAVLSIPSYNAALPGQEIEFQDVVQSFLAAAQQAGKTNLIIDLQANGGGIVDLGLDTFAQLFPSKRPNTQGNMVSNVGQDVIGRTFSNIEAGDRNQTTRNADLAAQWTVQADMNVDGAGFASWDDFIGPVLLHGGNFTKTFQLNYSNTAVTDQSQAGIIISGTNNRTGLTQVFNTSDMIMLYDGYCASTCTVFSELMKSLGGVQSIAVGGRPQLAAMQGVGGVKGSNIQEFSTLIGIASEASQIANESVLAKVGCFKLSTSPADCFPGPRHRVPEYQRAAPSACPRTCSSRRC
jgi:Peptidase family S41